MKDARWPLLALLIGMISGVLLADWCCGGLSGDNGVRRAEKRESIQESSRPMETSLLLEREQGLGTRHITVPIELFDHLGFSGMRFDAEAQKVLMNEKLERLLGLTKQQAAEIEQSLQSHIQALFRRDREIAILTQGDDATIIEVPGRPNEAREFKLAVEEDILKLTRDPMLGDALGSIIDGWLAEVTSSFSSKTRTYTIELLADGRNRVMRAVTGELPSVSVFSGEKPPSTRDRHLIQILTEQSD